MKNSQFESSRNCFHWIAQIIVPLFVMSASFVYTYTGDVTYVHVVFLALSLAVLVAFSVFNLAGSIVHTSNVIKVATFLPLFSYFIAELFDRGAFHKEFFYVSAELLFIILTFYAAKALRWTSVILYGMSVASLAFSIVVFWALAKGMNPLMINGYSMIAAICAFFPFAGAITAKGFLKLPFIMIAVTACSTVFFAKTRSLEIALAVGVLVYIAIKVTSRPKLVFAICLVVLAVAMVVFDVVYSYDMGIGNMYIMDYNTDVASLTDQSLQSGRNIIWPKVIDAIKESPLLGYGPTVSNFSITGIGLSTHNWYMHIMLQAGIIGLLAHLFMVISFVAPLTLRKDSLAHLGLSWFFVFLVNENFEVTFTQNNLLIGFIYTLIFAVSISFYRQQSIKSEARFKRRI